MQTVHLVENHPIYNPPYYQFIYSSILKISGSLYIKINPTIIGKIPHEKKNQINIRIDKDADELLAANWKALG